jgi:SOS-response transcriptional repressor LexA
MKGIERRRRREAEGYDDVNTYGVLAAEGFLPGYGLETGSVLGTAEIPFWRTGAMDFALPRPASIALREYVPGNLIYANGHRFVARRFHRDVDESRIEMPVFEVSIARMAIKETNLGATASTLGGANLGTIAVSDVDLVHQSHISDEEELRFQLGVSVLGIERNQHNGGRAFNWGPRPVHLRHGVRLRLVNIGASRVIEKDARLGYPLCTVCGQSVSPLSSEKQRTHFTESHQERCGRTVEPVGFYADVVADALSLPACENHETAYSVLEAIRFAAASVLDMHTEDLQVLVIGHVDRDEVDGFLWDQMPGGSGLLDQICARFGEIISVAKEILENCPSLCQSSCIDCLQTFRNAFYHKYLNRHTAFDQLKALGPGLAFAHDIPALQPTHAPQDAAQPVNEAERRLRYLLQAAGFPEGIRGEQIRLDRSIGTTTPDVIYRSPDHEQDEGVCIYLDGMSQHLHGHPATAEQDQRIRSWLRNKTYEVIEIAVSDLFDREAMTRHFRKLAIYLGANDIRSSLKNDTSWFEQADEEASSKGRFKLRLVRPRPEDRYVSCVPFVPLKAAAGAFSEPQNVQADDWEWIEIDTTRKLRPGMFVAQVVGKSMEPAVPDGSYCLFAAPVTGTRHGRTVLVQLDSADPETGDRYTVKRYESEKVTSDDGTWRHINITLKPNNPDFQPIVLTCEDEGTVRVIAELVEVMGL